MALTADSDIAQPGAGARLECLIDLAHHEEFHANSLRTDIAVASAVEWIQKSTRLVP